VGGTPASGDADRLADRYVLGRAVASGRRDAHTLRSPLAWPCVPAGGGGRWIITGFARRPSPARRRDERGRASGVANGSAPRRRLPQPWASRALNEVGVMLRGRGSERRPSWASHWKVRICGSPRMAGRSACVGAPPSAGSGNETPRRTSGEELSCLLERAIPAAASARRGRRPPLGGETTVARRTLCPERLGRPGAKGGAQQPTAASQKGGPSVALVRPSGQSNPLVRPGYPP
jgi:hypothetical protein